MIYGKKILHLGKFGKMRNVNFDFWKGKKVFLTGHTGFKGSWLSIWLMDMGAIVKGYSLEPTTNPSLFEKGNVSEGMVSEIGDVRNFNSLRSSILEFNPDVLFHLAAQPLVRDSFEDPLNTYEINVMGTANLLQACRFAPKLRSIVIVTTDKCYENKEWEWGYRENDILGGYDPYSSSKACTELVTSSFRRSFYLNSNVGIATARAGNVIGGGDWANDRLMPDIFRNYKKKQKLVVRNPSAIRPWQHVIEPLCGYLVLAESLYESPKLFSEPFNFGPRDEDCQSVSAILNQIDLLAEDFPGWRIDKKTNNHEARLLKLDISKAKFSLGWEPRWNINYSLKLTLNWYQRLNDGSDLTSMCLDQIKSYVDFQSINPK